MVLQTRDDEVTIKWYDESWSRKWKVYTYKESWNSESVAWVETLPIGDIIIGNILYRINQIMLIAKGNKGKTQRFVQLTGQPSRHYTTNWPGTQLSTSMLRYSSLNVIISYQEWINVLLILLVIKLYCGLIGCIYPHRKSCKPCIYKIM